MMSPSPSSAGKVKQTAPALQEQQPTQSKYRPDLLITSATGDESTEVSSSSPSTDAPKSQCSSLSDGESFECYGENDLMDGGGGGGSVSGGGAGIGRDGGANDLVNGINADPELNMNLNGEDGNGIFRHSWSRSSLRRPQPISGRRQLGSNALASQLYRSASFNSSGRSSNCDNTEEMYSDEDVQDLNHKFELLQRQVSTLAATQNTNEDVTTRTKTEYAVLQARYYMLEEQLRECELRGEQRLMEEQKNHKELLARAERESELQAENYQIKLKTTEKESNQLREEVQRLRILCDKQASDLHMTEEKLEITQDNYQALQQELDEVKAVERKLLAEKTVHEELMIELDKEMERMRAERGPALPTTSPESIRLEELHQELDELRQTNRNLSETNEELQALVLTRGVEEGINLLNGTSNSLAQELHDMSQSQLQSAFKDKEEENIRLKHYIDTILLNIVENYPQLLEVKSNSTTSSPKAMNISH